MQFEHDMEIVDLDFFDAAFLVAPGEEAAAKQRFMTLFVEADERAARGGSAQVRKARNMNGEVFALKILKRELSGSASGQKSGANTGGKVLRSSLASTDASSPVPDYVTRGHLHAFYEEYRAHLAVSSLRGFPRLYGFGTCGELFVMLMEWVEGVTLRDATRTGDAGLARGRIELPLLAKIGIAVLEQLQRAQELSESFVHRDISPRNIMIRTDKTPLDEQVRTGTFDVCLVDFGSSSLVSAGADPSFTMREGVWRKGTPTYAPPEMLTSDVELPGGYRQSQTIDTYALCSVLYELYAGSTPFDLHASRQTPYRVKTAGLPAPLDARKPDGGALAQTIVAGLAPQQEDRASIAELKAALENWLAAPGTRTAGAPHAPREPDRAFWQPQASARHVTRRQLVAAGIVGAAAVVAGALVGTKLMSRGVIDESRYERADVLYAGEPLFKVLDAGASGWSLATRDGHIACQPESSREIGALAEGLVAVYDDVSQLYGFVTPADTAGGCAWWVLPAYAQVRDFSDGLAAALDGASGLWGYIDASGAWAIRPQFADAASFSHGAAAVQANDEGRLWGAVDTSGTWVIEPRFAALGTRAASGACVAQDAQPADSAKSWGVVDADGAWTSDVRFCALRRIVVPGTAAAGRPPLTALAPARDAMSGLWGFVDSAGAWAVEPAFADARPFSEGLACVQDRATRLWRFVKPSGRAYQHMGARFWKLGELASGLAPAQATSEDSTVVLDDADPDSRVENAGMRYGYVDASGTWQMRPLTTLVNTAIAPASL